MDPKTDELKLIRPGGAELLRERLEKKKNERAKEIEDERHTGILTARRQAVIKLAEDQLDVSYGEISSMELSERKALEAVLSKGIWKKCLMQLPRMLLWFIPSIVVLALPLICIYIGFNSGWRYAAGLFGFCSIILFFMWFFLAIIGSDDCLYPQRIIKHYKYRNPYFVLFLTNRSLSQDKKDQVLKGMTSLLGP